MKNIIVSFIQKMMQKWTTRKKKKETAGEREMDRLYYPDYSYYDGVSSERFDGETYTTRNFAKFGGRNDPDYYEEKSNKRLATSNFRIPPYRYCFCIHQLSMLKFLLKFFLVENYRSMKEGINVHFVDITHGLQFRRLLREEMAAACGNSVFSTESGSGGHLFCFHVRIPPKSKRKKSKSTILMDYESLDFGDFFPDGSLVFEPGQEIQIKPVEHTESDEACDLGTGTVSSRKSFYDDNLDMTVYTIKVESFITTDSYFSLSSSMPKHGLLWCRF